MEKTPPPLSGLKVIDLSRSLAGPLCGQILADLGAEVIKIEPLSGDESRHWGPPFAGDTSVFFLGTNRNKRGMAVDLSHTDGQNILLTLLSDADVLLENFKLGTLAKWGLDYQKVLAQRFPRLIYCQISGFGQDGPLGGLAGYDSAVQARSGLMSINGEPTGDPMRIGLSLVDISSGLYSTIGILAALQERTHSGHGQSVESTLYDTALSLASVPLLSYLYTGTVATRTGNTHSTVAPCDAYPTKTQLLYLSVGNDRQFQTLCKILEAEELALDPRFTTNALRAQNNAALKQLLKPLLCVYDCQEIAERLIRQGIPCGPILNIDAVATSPHTQHRQMIVNLDDYQGIATPLKFSKSRPQYNRPPPQLGEQTYELLTELKLEPQEIERLYQTGIIK